jgi:hypothetical protein
MVNKRLQVLMPTCPGSVSDGLQPGDKRNTAKVAKTHHIAVKCKTAAALTSDSVRDHKRSHPRSQSRY